MVKCRYIPAYARVRFPMPGISVLGIRHPVDGYGAAAGARPRRVARPLKPTHDALPFLIIGKAPVRAAS